MNHVCIHAPIKDYAHFLIRKDLNYPAFNGYFSRITFGLSVPIILNDQPAFMNYLNSEKLPNVALPDKSIRTLSLIKSKTPVSKDNFQYQPALLLDYPEVEEYSISGWTRWVVVPGVDAWTLVARLAMGPPD